MIKAVLEMLCDNFKALYDVWAIKMSMWELMFNINRQYTVSLFLNNNTTPFTEWSSWNIRVTDRNRRNSSSFVWTQVQCGNKKIKYIIKKIMQLQRLYNLNWINKKAQINLDIEWWKNIEKLYNKILDKVAEWKIKTVMDSWLRGNTRYYYVWFDTFWDTANMSLMFPMINKDKIEEDLFYAYLKNYWFSTKEQINSFILYTTNHEVLEDLPKDVRKHISKHSKLASVCFNANDQTLSWREWFYTVLPKKHWIWVWKQIKEWMDVVEQSLIEIQKELLDRRENVAASDE